MNDKKINIKKLNILGSKAKELINTNKLLSNEISFFQKLFNSNKDYITLYFNTLAENKKNSKNKNNNNKTNNINNIKNIIINYHSEIKEINLTLKKDLKNSVQKSNIFLSKLISETKNLSEYYQKISEDNFLYYNAIQSKENFIKCLSKDLQTLKKTLIEDEKHIYLNYNFQNINKNENNSFDEGEKEIKYLLNEARRQFILDMRKRNDLRLKYRKKTVKKNALNDLVTSISFINKTEIIPSSNNNIFQILNKKIGGVIKNYERYFNEDEENIDENFFIFLPFEFEINKEEINEIVQTDITIPNRKLQSKSIKMYNSEKKTHGKNRSFIDVPRLNFLQIEFNKEKISYSESDSDSKNESKTYDNNNKIKDSNNNLENKEIDKENKKKKINKNEEDINLKIKELKYNIKSLKKRNRKMKLIINDFEKFQKKIKDKFIIYENKMLNNINNLEKDNKNNQENNNRVYFITEK